MGGVSARPLASQNSAPVLVQPPDQVTTDTVGYAQRVLADDPAAYWRLGDKTGTTATDVLGAHPGELVGAIGLGEPGALTDGNGAMRFDGATAAVRVLRGADLDLSRDLTIELWLNVSLATRQTLISTGPAREFELTLETSGALNFYNGNGLTYQNIASTRAVTAGVWQHVVVTRDAATRTVSFYVNGIQRGTGTYSLTPLSGTAPVYVGRSAAGFQYVNGSMDEVALYTHALGATQIAAHYANRGEGVPISLPLSATDPDGDAVSYGAVGLPAPLTLDPQTGVISGTLTATDAGIYVVTVSATDGVLTNTRAFSWTVSPLDRIPKIIGPPDQNTPENTPVDFSVTASDPEGTPLTFSAAGLPPGVTIDPVTGHIAGTPTFEAAGTYDVSVIAWDGQLGASTAFQWMVTNVPSPPTLAQPPDQLTIDTAGYAQKVLADDPAGFWRLSDAPGGTATDTVGNYPGDLLGTIGYNAPGALSDGDTAMRFDGATSAVRITRAASLDLSRDLTLELWLNVSLATRQTLLSTGAGREFELTLETSGALNFYQGDGATYENLSTSRVVTAGAWQHIAVVRDTSTRTISFYVNGVLKRSGTYSLTPTASSVPVYVGRQAGGLQYANGTLDEVAVYSHALTAEQVAIHYAARTSGEPVALQLLGTDPDADALTYSASGLPGPLTLDPNTGLITGTLTASAAGVYHVTANVSDGTRSSTRTFSWTVSPPNRAPAVTPPADQTSAEDTPVALDVVATDPEGSTLTFSAEGLPPGLTIDPATGRITGTPTFEAAGTYRVYVKVSDGLASAVRGFTWTVSNVDRMPVLAQPDDVVSSDNAGYAQRILADGPAGYWRLDDPAGTSAADTTGALPGELTGAFAFQQPGALSDGDTSLGFDGATTYARVTRPSSPDLAHDLTLELWINVSLSKRQTLISTGPAREFELTLETSGTLNFYQGNGTTYEHIISAPRAVAAGAWQHIVVTRTAATHTVTFYVNGVMRGNGTYYLEPVTSTAPIYLGRTAAGSQYANGCLDEVAVYAYPLTPAQIDAHFGLRPVSSAFVHLQLAALDPDGDSVMFGATGLPGSLTIDPATGLISGKLSINDAGTYLVTAIVSDGILSDSKTFVWTVAHTLTDPSDERRGDPSRYAQRVLTDGAIGYWRLDDAAGSDAADARGVHPGTVLGGVRIGQPGALTDGDASMRFDGSTAAIRVDRNPSMALDGNLTLELWVNVSLGTRQTLISTSPAREFELTLETSGTLNFYQGNGVTYENAWSSRPFLAAGVWQHVTVVRDTTTRTISFYVNGEPRGSVPYSLTPAGGTTPIYIGSTSGHSQYVDGWLDEVAVYAKALTPDQVAAHYALRAALPISALTVAADRQPPQVPGTTVTFTATASGGAAPYEFKWWVLQRGGWTIGQDWSPSATFNWTPTSVNPGGRIEVWARSSGDTANAPEKFAQMSYPIWTRPVARLAYPADGATADLASPLSWLPVDGAQAYWLYVGTAPGAADLANSGALNGTSYNGSAILDRLFSHWLAWDADASDTGRPDGYAVRIDGRRTDLGDLRPTTDCGSGPDLRPCLRVALPRLGRGIHSLQVSAYNWLGEAAADPVSITVPDGIVYVRLWTKVDGVWGYSDTWFSAVENTARFAFPLDGAVHVDLTQPLTWNDVPGAEAYSLTIGRSPGASDFLNLPDIHATSAMAPPLTDPAQLYARLGTKFGGTWRYTDVSFQAEPTAARLTLPEDGDTNVSLSGWFVWTTVPAADLYSLTIGTTPGAADVGTSGERSNNSFTLALPSGKTLYARLGTRYGGTWRYVDSSFTTEVVIPKATFLAPASSPVAPGAVQFQWTPVSGALGYFLSVGSVAGASDFGSSPQQIGLTDFTLNLPAGLTLYARLYTQYTPGDLTHFVDLPFQTAPVSSSPGDPDPTGLVAAYDFDEGIGSTVTDASGHGNTGYIKGATWAPGHTGGGLHFDGISDWVTIADAPSLKLTTAMTLEAWVKPESLTVWWNLIQKEAPNGLSYALYGDDLSRPAGYIHSGVDIGVHDNVVATAGAWVHMATTYDGAVLRMYVNGVEVANQPAPGTILVTSNPLRLGGDAYWGEFFHGVLDDVRIYAEVRTADQILGDMNTPVVAAPVR